MLVGVAARSGRAAPLSPDDRRDALVAVYLELARKHGRVPTTSEIARAAGVAEGTIYRAYPTKEALASDAVRAAFCPAPVRIEFMKINPDQPMRDRLVDYTRILQQRFTSLFVLMGALGLTEPPTDGDHTECIAAGRHRRSDPPAAACVPVHEQAVEPLRRLLVPDTDEITIPVGDLFQRLRLLTFSASHPGITDGRLLTPEEIVDTILYGVRRRLDAGTHPAAPHASLQTSHQSSHPDLPGHPDLVEQTV